MAAFARNVRTSNVENCGFEKDTVFTMEMVSESVTRDIAFNLLVKLRVSLNTTPPFALSLQVNRF